MNVDLKNKYRSFFRDGNFKACHILYMVVNDPNDENKGKFDHLALARLEAPDTAIDAFAHCRNVIIQNTGGMYEFIEAVESVLEELKWDHGDLLRRKFANGETIRSECVKRAIENFIKTVEASDLYDFEHEGERILDRIKGLKEMTDDISMCENAIKVVQNFKDGGENEYMDAFYEFRDKFKQPEAKQLIGLKTFKEKMENGDFHIYAYEREGFAKEARRYHLMEGKKEISTNKVPSFSVRENDFDINALYITECVIGDCGKLGKRVVPFEAPYGEKTLFYIEPVKEKCVQYTFLINGEEKKTAKSPKFAVKKHEGKEYRIRIDFDENEMETQLMLAKNNMAEPKSKLEKRVEAGGSETIYFIQQALMMIKKTDKKTYDKMFSFHRSKNEDYIRKTFGVLSFLLATQSEKEQAA